MRGLTIEARHEIWPLRQAFSISRGSKIVADVVVATVTDGTHTGRGEVVPYARYGETVEGVIAAINGATFLDRIDLQQHLPPGAARNALDCALWDLEAKQRHTRVAGQAGNGALSPLLTAFTLSLDTPDAMAAAARAVANLPLLKLKLGGAGDPDRMRAVRAARPDARLIADANEAWTIDLFPLLMAVAAETGMETIEQPLPQGADTALTSLPHTVPICADESVRTAADIPRLAGLYDAVNIKLDKAGGLTGALALQRAARAAGLKIMAGSMVSTSLAIAPAFILAQEAEWVDLDGPLLLTQDRVPGFTITNGIMAPPVPELWG